MDIKAFCTAHSMDLGQAAVSLQGGSFSLVELKTSPVAFLLLAEDDYERGGLSALINATTNAKRAIVSQMDQLLVSFGFGSFCSGQLIPDTVLSFSSVFAGASPSLN
jgi:hypothetical protein